MTLITAAPDAATDKTLKGHKLLFLVPYPYPADFVARLQSKFPGLEVAHHDLPWAARAPGEGFPADGWRDVTMLITGNALPTRDQAPRLQYVQLLSAGAERFLQNPLFTETDIAFCTANGVHGPQISEWIISTWLAAQKRLPKYLEQQREGRWVRSSGAADDAVGQRIGILGYGSIGRQSARVATALGMEVYAYTLHPRDTPESRRDESYAPPGLGDLDGVLPARWFSGGATEDLHAFLGAGLDLLVVALPLTPKTRGLLGAPEFAVLAQRRTFVSNIGRGPIIRTDDLVAALNGGLIRGAALDVTDPEPLPDGHPLWSAQNVIITPHISGASSAYFTRCCAILENNLDRLSEGRPLTNRVSRKEGY